MASFRENYLQHHFSEATRAARRNLLLMSVLTYLLVRGQLVPAKIEFLGLNVGALQHQTLMQVLFALLCYYFLKFILYWITDGEVHMDRAYESLLDPQQVKTRKEHQSAVQAKSRKAFAQVGGWGIAFLATRVAFDGLLPVILGGLSIIMVLDAL